MGENLTQIQDRRFKEQIAEFLKDELKIKTEFNEGAILQSAKINYPGSLNKSQLSMLLYVSNSWNSEFEIKRSGAGIVINFKTNLK